MPLEKPLEITYAIVAGDTVLRLVEAYLAARSAEPTLPWPDDFQEAFQSFQASHAHLKTVFATSKDVPLRVIDQASDRALGGLASLLAALQQIFSSPPLSLSPEQASLQADASKLASELFPNGVSPIIHSEYRDQWVKTDALLRAWQDTPALQQASQRLALTPICTWLQSLHASYGAKLGITSDQTSTERVQALASWHEGYGELLLVASYHKKRGAKTDRLLALVEPPYQEELRRLQAEKAALRPKKEEKKTDPIPPLPS